MRKLYLPHVVLPSEFMTLLKTNLAGTTTSAPIFDVIRPNQAIYHTLEMAFKEFDDGRGLEKTMVALGWSNFRDRMASLYVYKSIYGSFPNNTNMELVDEAKQLEIRFHNHGVNSLSRIFLLGFYIKLANIQIERAENNNLMEIKIPEELGAFLKISHGRSEKIDWLILITLHLLNGLGDKMLMNALLAGKKMDELYHLMNPDLRKNMMDNLLAYGASIQEQDIFIYDKV